MWVIYLFGEERTASDTVLMGLVFYLGVKPESLSRVKLLTYINKKGQF
jgi:hypothetical protein